MTHESISNHNELSPSQQALKELADEMLAIREHELNVVRFTVNLNPQDVERKMKESAFSDLLLSDGDSFSYTPTNDYYPELGLFMGQAEPIQAEVRAWGWDYDSEGKPIKSHVTEDGRELLVGNWGREIDVVLWYSNDEQSAYQALSATTWKHRGYDVPTVYRGLNAPAYAEMGYEGHNKISRDATEDEVMNLLLLARELFQARYIK